MRLDNCLLKFVNYMVNDINKGEIMKSYIKAISLLALATSTQQAMAVPTDFDFSGNFTKDNDVVLLDFTVGSDSTITIFSSSWIAGGLDPILAIWDSSGNKRSEQDDGGLAGTQFSNGVAYNYGEWDSYYDVFLTAGNYTASIGMYDNFAVSSFLSDGFTRDAEPNFSSAFGCSSGIFCGVYTADDNRTSDWEFHILNVESASNRNDGTVPEPSTIAMLSLGVAGIGFQACRKHQKS